VTSSTIIDQFAKIRRIEDAKSEAVKGIEHLRFMATYYEQAGQPHKAKRVRDQIRKIEAITR
jgi:hypothetical protein